MSQKKRLINLCNYLHTSSMKSFEKDATASLITRVCGTLLLVASPLTPSAIQYSREALDGPLTSSEIIDFWRWVWNIHHAKLALLIDGIKEIQIISESTESLDTPLTSYAIIYKPNFLILGVGRDYVTYNSLRYSNLHCSRLFFIFFYYLHVSDHP